MELPCITEQGKIVRKLFPIGNICACTMRGVLWTFSFVEIGINHPSGGILAIKLPCITDQGTIVQGCFQAERSARLLRGVVWTFPFVEIGINHLSGAILAMEFPCIMEQGKIVQELFPTVGNISARTMRGVLWTFSFVEIGINHPSGGTLAIKLPCITDQGTIV